MMVEEGEQSGSHNETETSPDDPLLAPVSSTANGALSWINSANLTQEQSSPTL